MNGMVESRHCTKTWKHTQGVQNDETDLFDRSLSVVERREIHLNVKIRVINFLGIQSTGSPFHVHQPQGGTSAYLSTNRRFTASRTIGFNINSGVSSTSLSLLLSFLYFKPTRTWCVVFNGDRLRGNPVPS